MQILGGISIYLIIFYNGLNVGEGSSAKIQTPKQQVLKILDSLKWHYSNCTIQQQLIKEIKQGKVERYTFLNYSGLFDGEKEELIGLIPEGKFLSTRLLNLNDYDMLKVARFISRNFRRSCDQAIENEIN